MKTDSNNNVRMGTPIGASPALESDKFSQKPSRSQWKEARATAEEIQAADAFTVRTIANTLAAFGGHVIATTFPQQ